MSSISVRFYSFSSLYSIFNEHKLSTLLVDWSVWMDSNHRPRAYQARALTTWATDRFFSVFRFVPFSPILGLNFRWVVEMMGFEPMTPCLQGRCSPSWATPPFPGFALFFFKDLTDPWKLNNKSSIRASLKTSLVKSTPRSPWKDLMVSIERRWSSRTFRYGYLVTT